MNNCVRRQSGQAHLPGTRKIEHAERERTTTKTWDLAERVVWPQSNVFMLLEMRHQSPHFRLIEICSRIASGRRNGWEDLLAAWEMIFAWSSQEPADPCYPAERRPSSGLIVRLAMGVAHYSREAISLCPKEPTYSRFVRVATLFPRSSARTAVGTEHL